MDRMLERVEDFMMKMAMAGITCNNRSCCIVCDLVLNSKSTPDSGVLIDNAWEWKILRAWRIHTNCRTLHGFLEGEFFASLTFRCVKISIISPEILHCYVNTVNIFRDSFYRKSFYYLHFYLIHTSFLFTAEFNFVSSLHSLGFSPNLLPWLN